MTSASQEQVKILVAEDEKDIRELVSITMRLAGSFFSRPKARRQRFSKGWHPAQQHIS